MEALSAVRARRYWQQTLLHVPQTQERALHSLGKYLTSAGDRLKRVLFLTDSVLSTLSSSPENLFEAAQKHVYQEDKLSAGRVADIDNFSPEFAHSDIVIVSCGINDLSRYGKTDIATSRFREYDTRTPSSSEHRVTDERLFLAEQI